MLGLQKKTKNKIITLASKHNIKIINLAKIILKLTKSKSKIILKNDNKRVDDFTSNYNYDKNLFGWKPKYSLDIGLMEYIKTKLK